LTWLNLHAPLPKSKHGLVVTFIAMQLGTFEAYFYCFLCKLNNASFFDVFYTRGGMLAQVASLMENYLFIYFF